MAGMRPGVGFSPQIPLKCAGTRIDPHRRCRLRRLTCRRQSRPLPHHSILPACAQDPRDYWFARKEDCPSPMPSAVRWHWSRPRMIAPAWRKRVTSGASCAGTKPARNLDPDSQRRPATSIALLMLSGTPCSGPSLSPSGRHSSAIRLAGALPLHLLARRRLVSDSVPGFG